MPKADYHDNVESVLFSSSRAVLEACKVLDFQPDIIHCNDWQTGLIPCYLKTTFARRSFFAKTPDPFFPFTTWAIKEISTNGICRWHTCPGKCSPSEGIEFYGFFSFMKAGLVYADLLTGNRQQNLQQRNPDTRIWVPAWKACCNHYQGKVCTVL